MHLGVTNLVLLSKRVVHLIVRVLMTRFIVRSLHLSQATLQSRSPATLAFVSAIKGIQAQKNGAFGEISAKSTPEGVPLAGFVIRARDLQEPVPDCNHNAPAVDSP